MDYQDAVPGVENRAPPPPPKDGAVPPRGDSLDYNRRYSLPRKPLPGSVQQPSILLQKPSYYDSAEDTTAGGRESRQSGSSLAHSSPHHSRDPSGELLGERGLRDSGNSIAVTREIPLHQLSINDSYNPRLSQAAQVETVHPRYSQTVHMETIHGSSDESPQSLSSYDQSEYSSERPESFPSLQYHHQPAPPQPQMLARETLQSPSSDSQRSSSDQSLPRFNYNPGSELQVPRSTVPRPSSAYTLGSELNARGRTHSPHLSVGGSPSPNGSPLTAGRPLSATRRSPENRPTSYVDLLNVPYSQQVAPVANLGNTALRSAVGSNASILETKKTLEMYKANVKKTQDSNVQYNFAVFLTNIAQEIIASGPTYGNQGLDPPELLREARSILQKLADRSHPFAQYFLADGYASGLFNKDKEDYDRAFPLFVAASKHGHAESGYRAGLCYEFGWGCRKDYAKAVQFYRAAASKNHPGAATRLGKACLTGDMGLVNRYREGVKWLKRATESADHQYNSAPYELGLLHETGYGEDIFKDETYALQLFTKAAECGHPQAALKLGEAYEHGYLGCPKDAALSVHYYNCAAQADIPEAMMNLCAWYMVGAEPVLDKDENEAYEWAKRAAEHGKQIPEKRINRI